jgi:hypothetical protein
MIESKLTFFQMPIEGLFPEPSNPEEPCFGIPPEALNPIHMRAVPDKFIFAVIDAEMFPIPHIDQAIIAAPPIRVDHTVQGHLPTNNPLQRGFSTVRDEFGVALSLPLKQAKDDGLAIGTSSSFPFDVTSTKVGLVDFYFASERRLRFTEFVDTCSKSRDRPIDRIALQSHQEGHL